MESCRQTLLDVKLHVDPQVDPDWNSVFPTYLAMIIYKEDGDGDS
jgi:hypothetical protein